MRISRRGVLTIAAATPLAAQASAQTPVATTVRTRLFLYDADAPLAGYYRQARGRSASVETIAIDGDLGDVWHALDRRLALQPAIVSGVTSRAHLFCIQVLASGRRLRPVGQGAAPLTMAAAGAALFPHGAVSLDDPAGDADHLFWSFAPVSPETPVT